MDEATKAKLVDLAINTYEDVRQWVQGIATEQAPEVAKEIVAFGFAEGVLWAFLSGIVSAALILGYRALWKVTSDPFDEGHFSLRLVGGVWVGAFLLVSITLCINSALGAIKACVAPRLYVIEWMATLAK